MIQRSEPSLPRKVLALVLHRRGPSGRTLLAAFTLLVALPGFACSGPSRSLSITTTQTNAGNTTTVSIPFAELNPIEEIFSLAVVGGDFEVPLWDQDFVRESLHAGQLYASEVCALSATTLDVRVDIVAAGDHRTNPRTDPWMTRTTFSLSPKDSW